MKHSLKRTSTSSPPMNETPNETFETPSNETDVALVDGVAVVDGHPVAEAGASNTGDEAIERGPEIVFVHLRLPRALTVGALRDRGFLGDADSDEDITRAVLGMLAAAWKAGIRAEAS
jgi:hypothetical protein